VRYSITVRRTKIVRAAIAAIPEAAWVQIPIVPGGLAQVAKTSYRGDPGNACGWVDLAAVLAALGSGATYVNVHTNDGVAPPNTGPGDFPGGEIRGQTR
jgi:hypothetical protein